MGLFPLKGRAQFLGRSRRTLEELQALGAAATAGGMQTLAKLTGTAVRAERTHVYLVPRARVAALLAHHAGAEIAARFQVTGANPGVVATLFAKDDAVRLVELLMGREPGAVKRLGPVEESAVAEMTNIALNGCLNAVSERDGTRFATGVPEVHYRVKDPGAFFAFDAPAEVDHAVVVETPFVEPTRGVEGHVVLLFGVARGGEE